jgi:hypothetical protein
MFMFSVIFRLVWSFTIGLPFFSVGLMLFLVFDILSPESDRGYRILNIMYKWGSCYWFKGLRMEKDEFEINVTKSRDGE